MSKKIKGILSIASKGFGFVTPTKKNSSMPDIYIHKTNLLNAFNKDIVEVELTKTNKKDKKFEGKIVKIVERHSKTLVATIIRKHNNHYFGAISSIGKLKFAEIETNIKLKKNDRVLINVIDFGDEFSEIKASLNKVLGNFNDPSIDSNIAALEYDIKEDFPSSVINEAEKIKKRLDLKKEKKSRKNFLDLETITIDPTTAKDFDDAISIEKLAGDGYKLYVHIADVANYIKPDNQLDKEAFLRGNSTYFPDKCIPMLPFIFSNDLCSLRPNEEKLCISVIMTFDKKGNLKNHKIVRSIILSKKRFTYEQALKVIQKEEESPYFDFLKNCVDLCNLLNKKRFNRGSINFALPDTKIELDENKGPEKIKIVEYDISHLLIEEFMLKANEIVAKELTDRGKVLIYRIHENPSKEHFEDFFAFARILGFKLPQNPNHLDIQKLFLEAKETPYLNQLSIYFIRSMKTAFYSNENIGHYGLALDHYCHFTSPIRRYSDLVIQRLLFNEEDEKRDLSKIAKICSEKERNSFKAESSVITLKKMRLLKKIIKEKGKEKFKAKIIEIKPYFIVFEIEDILISGSIHISKLNDYYIYDHKSMTLTGEFTHHKYSFYDTITVKPINIDFAFNKVDWEMCLKKPKNTTKKKKSKKKKKRK